MMRASLQSESQIKRQSFFSMFNSVLESVKNDSLNRLGGFVGRNQTSSSIDIIRRHRPDYIMLLCMLLLMLVGLVVMFAISPQIINAKASPSHPYHYFQRQLIIVMLCLVAFGFMARKPFDSWRKSLVYLLLVPALFSLLLFVLAQLKPDLVCSLGACRWLRLGFFSVQVSEVTKACILIFFALVWSYLAKKSKLNQVLNLKFSLPIITVALLTIVVLQKDLGTGASLFVFLLFMMLMAGVKKHYLLAIIGLAAISLVAFIALQPYRVARFKTFIAGEAADMTDANRHIIEAKIALGSGGWLGLGVGNSIQSTGYLPEVINDSVFAIIGEVFGFIGAIFVILLFVALLWRLLRAILLSHDLAHRLVFTGVFAWILAHLFFNIASMTGLMPMTGITLPFVSYGGSSMLLISMVLGLAFQLSSYTAHTPYYQYNLEKRHVKI